jgi:hypothetical protein
MRNGLFCFVLKITKHTKLAVSRNTEFRETACLFHKTVNSFRETKSETSFAGNPNQKIRLLAKYFGRAHYLFIEANLQKTAAAK